MKKILLLIILTIFVFVCNIFAQDFDGWRLNGQIQLRSEIDGRDFSNDTHALTYASLRTRLGVGKTFNEKVQLFVQFQDSRVFGEEPSTLSPIDNIDLHQGFVKLMKPFGWDFNVQAGRFEVSYGTERFFGPVGWHYVGRSFDGVRFEIATSSFPFDLFALTINESNNYIANASFLTYPFPENKTPSVSIYGFNKKFDISRESRLDVLGYFENDRFDTNQGDDRLKMFTLAGTYWGNYGDLSTIVEAAYQFGEIGVTDISAYLVSVSGNYKLDEMAVGAGADFLSGGISDDFNTFQATYGTNHKFYGYMDYFINIPANTLFSGLNDFYANVNYQPQNSFFSFSAALHHFMSNKSILITTIENPVGNEENTFGQELDLSVKYDFVKGTSISWGGSLFFQGDIMKAFFAPREDTAFWTYVMITANL